MLAAGGVVSGRGLLAALALGCDGVVMGTRFGTSQWYKAVVRSGIAYASVAIYLHEPC